MGGDRTRSGRWGEAQVAQWLQRRGYQLLATNWASRYGEIDLIASNEGYLCFVEVKLRKNANFAQAREFVSQSKQRRLRITAELYLAQNPTDLQPRFDVAEVYAPNGETTAEPDIIYLENAF